MEGIVFQEEVIEDFIAVLLVDIAALVLSVLIFHTQPQSVFTVLIVQNFQFRFRNIFQYMFDSYG